MPSKLLADPAPDRETLLAMLAAAVRVPDHGKREPWRFLQVSGPARDALGAALVARALQRDPQASEAVLDKDRNRFQSPLVVAVIARLGADEKIPESERFASACCVCFALLQAAQGHGFGAQWLTGWPAYDPEILRLLGLAEHERIAGFIHIGTPKALPRERERPHPATLLDDWNPA